MTAQTGQQRFYRRLIDLHCTDDATVTAWLEDDFHHFGVTVIHDGKAIVDIHAAAPRYPWTTCPGALHELRALIGKPLVRRASDIGRLLQMRTQCTHLFDLTGLALAHACQRREHRRYEVVVPYRELSGGKNGVPWIFGPVTVVMKQNGECVARWSLDDQIITAPAEHAGQSLRRGFREWTEAMPEQEAEYATILRRAIMVGSARPIDMEGVETAADFGNAAVCYSFQPERSRIALRKADSLRDFSGGNQGMLIETASIP